MSNFKWKTVATSALLLSAAGALRGQAAQRAKAIAVAALPGTPPGTVVRAIDDLPLGERWLLVRDASHPAGPGRLVLAAVKPGDSPAVAGGGSPAPKLSGAGPVIRTGDRVIVEEETAVVDVHLEAVALGAAQAGGVFEARLRIGGNRLRAVALGPGRAAFQAEVSPFEVQP